jgi:hypothetical protein
MAESRFNGGRFCRNQKTSAGKCSAVENCSSEAQSRVRAGIFDENLEAILKSLIVDPNAGANA